MADEERDNRPVIILILGLLSVVTCPLLGPVAIVMGNTYKRDAIMAGREPEQLATAGRILGFVGTALILIQILVIALAFALGVFGAIIQG